MGHTEMTMACWMRGLLTLGLRGLFIAGCAAALLLPIDVMAETTQAGTAPLGPATSSTQVLGSTKLTPEQEAALGEVRKILREASQIAQNVVIKNPESKDGTFLQNNKNFVLGGIVSAQARAGDIEGARLTAGANQWNSSFPIAIAQAKAGAPYEALKSVDTSNFRPQALQVILEALHKSGDRRTAFEVIEKVYMPWDRAEALFLYARFLAKAGDPAANEVAQRAYTFSNTLAKGGPWVYVRLAEFQADAGDSTASHQSFQKARDAAFAASDVQQQFKGLLMVAQAQTHNRDQPGSEKTMAEAIRLAKGLPAKQQEIELGEIVRKQLAVGNRTAASETVRLILQLPGGSSPYDQADGLMRQARWHLTLGDRETAKTALQTVLPQVRAIANEPATPELEKNYIHYGLARLAADIGLYNLAQEAVRAITNDQSKSQLIRAIVTGVITAPESPEVQQVIQTLVEDATSLTGILSFPRDITLLDVAVIQAEAGEVKAAVRTADRVAEVLRDNTYREMVEILIEKKNWVGAEEVLSRMKAEWMRNESSQHVFRALTKAEVQAGVGQRAREWARKQLDSIARANALLGVAEGLMESVGIEPLLPVVRP